ncbi:thermonuclease family protein [Lyngbya sp. CCY1209]|uniref:thermonuclease family protein n=1 Tax=Lyngbya sp. CCY1209 TaxID=2886103 RepID=UPI002D1FD98A|nr:thermonuclease family protein [Lyngbya sp. CCY1209]MEB3884403.1 thermonuclease family protein [Lyngbya sp. CCY1209]
MKKLTAIINLIASITLAIYPQIVRANPRSAVVEKIVDGDTVVFNEGGTSRTAQLACIDAPDWVNGSPEPHAETSKNRLNSLIPAGSSVQYYDLGTIGGGRVLAVIFKNNQNINLQMVAEGQARLHRSYRQTCNSSANSLSEAESAAQSRGLGIWQN